MSLLDALPSTDALGPALALLPTRVSLPDLDVSGLGSEIAGSAPPVSGDPLEGAIPDLRDAPSPEGFQRALDEPLAAATAVDGPSLVASARASLPASPPAPDFDIQGVVGRITSPVLPSGVGPVKTDVPFPPELGDLSAPLRRLTEAGAATPLRLLQAMLTVLDRLVETATDADRLKAFTAEALGEILVAQTREVRDHLPLASLEQARAALDADFLGRFERLLEDLEAVKDASGPELLDVLETVRVGTLPALRHYRRAATTLGYLRANDTEALERALANVTGFATADEVFLAEVFDSVEEKVGAVLDAVAGPVQELAAMIDQIRAYLEQVADMAEGAARSIAEKLDDTLRTVSEHLQTARERIEEIAGQVRAFIERVDVGPAIESFKDGCTAVADGVDGFFTQVEQVRKQLDDAVAKLASDVETQVDDGLRELRAQIERLLSEITGVLDRDDVKQVLDQAREGVDRLKGVIDQASLQAVFDVVVRKTGELEGKVQAIDTSRLGTPQKTALKVGVKIIREVNVDEVVRPELESVFAEILEPIRELIGLLRDRVLVVEQRIDEFRPGTLVAGVVDPHLQRLLDQLDSFRPSHLLKPVKDALATLQGVLEQLDPQRVLDRLQDAYAQLRELVDALEPTPLNARVSQAANTAVRQIVQLRDVYLEDILKAVRDNVSLRKLLEGTGVAEIADAELWDTLRRVLGGGYLDRITEAVDEVEEALGREFGSLDYGDAAREVAETLAAVTAQRSLTATAYRTAVNGLVTALEDASQKVGELEQRRTVLLEGGEVTRPEVEEALRALDLQPVLDLLAALRGVAAMEAAGRSAALAKVKAACDPHVAALKALDEARIRQAVPAIFERQIGDPVRGFVTRMQEKLQPFADAVTAIQEFVRAVLQVLPARIDAAVGLVLDTLRTDLRAASEEVIETIRAVRDQITATIDAAYRQVVEQIEKVNPNFVLNSFGRRDFVGTASPPEGAAALARKVASPGDDEAAALLQARLSDEQLALVRGRSGDYAAALLAALNGALRDEAFAARLLPSGRERLAAQRRAHEQAMGTAEGDAWVAARKGVLRTLALERQVDAAQRAFAAPATRREGAVRLSRALLEAYYPAELKMGLTGLHPYVVATVGELYPEETVQRIDRTYAALIARVRTLPNELIAEPLDDAFDAVKDKLRETFDIRGLFQVLDIKLEGMEGDLSRGLERLGVAYNRLIGTLDQRLSG
jgi:ElaB/YqjD/DUF883 family membrane-anchored ribosome-binding protein